MEELISVTGLRLHSIHWPPQEDPKAAVFVAHGVSEHTGRYEVLAKSLNERGYLVFAHDHVGHGLSEGDRIHIDTIETYARDVILHVERFKVKHPTLPVFLFGHSMGGTIAAYTTVLRQDLFCGLILSGAALVPSPEAAGFFLRLAARVLAVLSPQLGIKAVSPDTISRIQEEVDKYVNDPLVYHGKLKAKWAVAMLNAAEFLGQHFSEISIPLLLVHGDADQLVPIESSEFGYRTASSTDKTFEVFKGGFHETLNDRERDRFLLVVGEWLDRQVDKGDSNAAVEGSAAGRGEDPKDAPGGAPMTGEPPTDVPPEGTIESESTEAGQGEPPKDSAIEGEPPKDEPTEGELPKDEATEGEPPKDEAPPEAPQPSEQVTEYEGAVEDGGEQDTTEDNQ